MSIHKRPTATRDIIIGMNRIVRVTPASALPVPEYSMSRARINPETLGSSAVMTTHCNVNDTEFQNRPS